MIGLLHRWKATSGYLMFALLAEVVMQQCAGW